MMTMDSEVDDLRSLVMVVEKFRPTEGLGRRDAILLSAERLIALFLKGSPTQILALRTA